jgi:hypothetical protein
MGTIKKGIAALERLSTKTLLTILGALLGVGIISMLIVTDTFATIFG